MSPRQPPEPTPSNASDYLSAIDTAIGQAEVELTNLRYARLCMARSLAHAAYLRHERSKTGKHSPIPYAKVPTIR